MGCLVPFSKGDQSPARKGTPLTASFVLRNWEMAGLVSGQIRDPRLFGDAHI